MTLRWPEGRRRVDALVTVVFAIVGAIYAHRIASLVDPVVLSYGDNRIVTTDMWFDGDVPKTYAAMTDRLAEQHGLTSEHPLASLVLYPPVRAIELVTGGTPRSSARLAVDLLAGIWAACTFLFLRLLRVKAFDASLLTCLGLVSASAMCWFAVPEMFSIGSITILVALGLGIWADNAVRPAVWHVVASAISLSMTVTNWSVGLITTFAANTRKAALAISAGALAIVTTLWVGQHLLFPTSELFVGSRRLMQFVFLRNPFNIARVVASFVSHTLVMPNVQASERRAGWQVLTVQSSWPGSATIAGVIAVAAWLALLAVAVWSYTEASETNRRRQRLIGTAIAAQLALHVLFGAETFLYSMHFLPLLLGAAAFALLGRWRVPALALVSVVLVCAALNNATQFGRAAEFVHSIGSQVRALPVATSDLTGVGSR